MSLSTQAPPPTPPEETEASLSTINDILLHRILHPEDVPLFSDPDQNRVVAIIGPSNLDYIITLFALSRLGYAVLLLSTRLSTEAYGNLLAKTNCNYILNSSATEKAVAPVRDAVRGVNAFLIPEFSLYSKCTERSELQPTGGTGVSRKWAFIIHSSGSTGLPKPIFQTHAACIANYTTSNSYRALLTLPLYHNHGLCTFFRSLFKAKPIAIYNSNLPLTGKNILEVMQVFQPESFHGQVLFGGSSCPYDLGDYLVNKGVWLISHYGATELGQLMTSGLPNGDKLWNYVRPLKSTQPYLQMEELEDVSYECIALDGLPAKVSSNCDDPPNSFRTRDTFLKHPSIPNAWKYLGRIDDRVTLATGEKVLPVPIEHRIRKNKYVKDNLVFGVGKPLPGLIIVPSTECQSLSKEAIVDIVWPDIEAANQNAESFSQISRDMVIVLDVGATYPATDKGTMIRNRSYNEFSSLIEAAYQRLESDSSNSGPKLALSLEDLQEYLLKLFKAELGFTGIGLDLQAIKARAIIQKNIDIGHAELGHNVVFDFATIRKFASHLYALRTGDREDEEDEITVMSQLIHKYSSFVTGPRSEEVVLLTGTTGSLGIHILSRLMQKHSVKKVYCLVRAPDTSSALDRVLSNLASRSLPMVNVSKIVALPAQLGSEDLELAGSILSGLRASLTKVIHSAWAVNFTLGVRSFEAQHIKGVHNLHNLINLCLSSDRASPAQFYFCSSISAAAGTPLPATIAEAPVPELAHAQGMGYARSKLVAERIVQAAAKETGMVAKVLRVGQIADDSVRKWNITEAIPLMLQTAQTLKALPALDETPSWLPVDIVADAVLDLANLNDTRSPALTQFSHDPDTVYHIQNARTFRWTEDLLPALKAAGLDFEVFEKRQWVQRLREGDRDPKRNPAIKLLDNDNPGRSGLLFEMEKSEAANPALRGGVELIESGLIRKFVNAWRREW
ncbi:uncharacterized protein BDV17DRAFT_284616 [Aspergillus undulatus]|uniref:uncharacterized protein n=1 Tax=Aspergillus undulatus TaxID=1810928 RepID=UPI003CCCDD78